MKVYKLRHKPTGLFFQPGRYKDKRRDVYKTTLSEHGKIYSVIPKINWAGHPGHHLHTSTGHAYGYRKEDWEVVEFEIG